MPSKRERHVIRWRRKKLPDGKYLNIAVTKEKGPRGGRTLAYVQTSASGSKVYPARTEEPRTRKVRRRKHGRQVRVRSKA